MPDLISAVEDYLHNPRGIGNVGTIVETIERVVLEDAVAASGIVEGEAVLPEVAAIGAGLLGFGGWPILLFLCAFIILCKILEALMLGFFARLPWGWGKGPTAYTQAVFGPIDRVEAWIGARLADIATNLITNFLLMVRNALQIVYPQTTHGKLIVQPANISHLQGEIDGIRGELATDALAIHNLQAHVYHANTPSVNITPLENRIARLEQNEATIVHDLNVLHSNQVALSHQLASLSGQVAGMEHNYNAVRAVQYGIQDWLLVLQTKMLVLDHDIGVLAPQVDAATRQILLMKPLEALLTRGSAGIRNLQRLEDNPCQCKGFGGLPLNLPDPLAVLEFIENG